MNNFTRLLLLLLFPFTLTAQHLNKINATVDADNKVIHVVQEITYFNESNDTINQLILNDWNNAYNGKETPLARRFSDEYVRAFHLAKDHERGSTNISSVVDQNGRLLNWKRPDENPDIVDVQLNNPIYPNHKFTINLRYNVKIPSDRFTKFGYDNDGNFRLKDWYLVPARHTDGKFVVYSNENLDDISNAISDYELTLTVPKNLSVTSDLYIGDKKEVTGNTIKYFLVGKQFNNFNLVLESNNSFKVYRNSVAEVSTNLKDNRITEIQKTLLIDQITRYVDSVLGRYPNGKIMVTQTDYERNPVYGLNQLPAFLSPFPDSFTYEIRFLKTYLYANLKNTLKLDPRNEAWIYDGIQIYMMMKYMVDFYPDKKMMGQLSEWGILKGYHIFQINYNDKYNYLYLLMARKNLDQPIGMPKDDLIKFNEQLAGRYKSGLGLAYLDAYTENPDYAVKAISEFYKLNSERQADEDDFTKILKKGTTKDISWYFSSYVHTRDIIDYKFGKAKIVGDSVHFTVKNKTGAPAPIPVYGIKNKKVIFKQWLNVFATDTTLVLPANGADKLYLNYASEVPEYNLRNNSRKLKGFFPNQKPYKFTFFQDLEDPRYNQIFYVPSFSFNIYDGFSPGLRFHNKSLLEKPITVDVEPTYSIKTGKLIGSFSLAYNNYIREGSLYQMRYSVSGSTYHYAPDALYIKFTPAVQLRMRDDDFRKNKKEFITLRQVIVDREPSAFVVTDEQNQSYSVFNARYSKYESEITRHYNFYSDVQLSSAFGKLAGEVQFRRLFNDNRQINLRFYGAAFMYRNTSSDFFSISLDRPSDYMFDYNYYGRSETSGLFSQQFIMAEGGFKSMFKTRFANQWLTAVNGSFNIWNWIEVYGDAGFYKNQYVKPQFVYDSGIRLNLLPDYFELYFPVYSSNGFEMDDGNYNEKIRFVVTISPGTLINLFTRKWF